jgi:hypothetical protein
MERIKELWQRHFDAEFPSDCRGLEISGIDLVDLDSSTAGIISSFLDQGRRLDLHQRDVLNRCRQALSVVLPELNDESRGYYANLKVLADLVESHA